jgi:hypothetical protein
MELTPADIKNGMKSRLFSEVSLDQFHRCIYGRSSEASLLKSEDVMQQRSASTAWFPTVKGLHKRSAKTVEPSVTVAAPIAMNAK